MKQKKLICWIFTMILALVNIGFTLTVVRLRILPVKLTAAILLIAWILSICSMVLMLCTKKAAIWGAILSVLMTVLLCFGMYYLYHTQKMLDQVVESSDIMIETDTISAYVLKDDPALDISDTENYCFGILKELDRENTDEAIAELEEKTGFSLQYREYEDLFLMVDELYTDKIDAIILNESFVNLIAENEGYETFPEDIRPLLTTVRQEEIAVNPPDEIKVTEPDGPAMDGFFIAYISGIDTYGGVTNRSNSDVNILAVVNTETKQILLLSTPRDYFVELSISNGKKDKLTHAGVYGVEVSMDTLGMLYDINVDYYLRMNFSGFIDIIDALGGVDVYSEYDFTVEPIMTYQKGYNHVDGLQALAFARERKKFPTGDNQRGKNQMEVIKAVIKKCTSSSVLKNYAGLMESVAGTFQTNITNQQIAELVNAQLFYNDEWNVVSYSVTGDNSSAVTYTMPGRSVYVMEPHWDSVEKAKELIRQVRDGKVLGE